MKRTSCVLTRHCTIWNARTIIITYTYERFYQWRFMNEITILRVSAATVWIATRLNARPRVVTCVLCHSVLYTYFVFRRSRKQDRRPPKSKRKKKDHFHTSSRGLLARDPSYSTTRRTVFIYAFTSTFIYVAAALIDYRHTYAIEQAVHIGIFYVGRKHLVRDDDIFAHCKFTPAVVEKTSRPPPPYAVAGMRCKQSTLKRTRVRGARVVQIYARANERRGYDDGGGGV